MKIRWKLLILLLILSLLPLLLLRLMGERAMRELGDDLADRSQKTLIQKAMAEMGRMAEDHARILGREKDLLELAVVAQALEAGNALSRPVPEGADPFFRTPRMRGHGQKGPLPGFSPSERHTRRTMAGQDMPLLVSMERLGFGMPGGIITDKARAEAARIDTLTPLLRALHEDHGDLILGQSVTLKDGLHGVFPAVQTGPRMFPDLTKAPWYEEAVRTDGPVWSRPEATSDTRRILLRVSCRVRGSDGPAGVASLVVPLSDVLAANPHTDAVSGNMRFLLVTPGNATDPYSLNVLGLDSASRREPEDRGHGMGRHWLAPVEPEQIPAPPGSPLARVLADIRAGKNGVRRIQARDRDEIWAYSVLDRYRTALVMIAPTSDVTREAEEARSFVVERIQRQILYSGLVLGAVVAVVFWAAFFTSRAVTTPLRRVADAVRQVAAGDWTTRVNLKSCDEIGDLACTFNEMIPQLHERYEMKAALDLAHEVQRSLLPKHSPDIRGVDVAGVIHYCDETGGDYYDFMPSPRGDCLSLVVGDVTGHGIPAALLMAAARAYVRSRTDKPGTPAEIATDVNRLLTEDCWETNRFVTMFYMMVNGPERSVRWVRAGHDPAMVFVPSTGEFLELKGPGMAMGLEKDVPFTDQERTLPPGAVVLVGTDGIWEAHDPTGSQFGYERFKQTVRENAGASAEEMAMAVTNAVEAFQGDAPREDDITLVVVKFS